MAKSNKNGKKEVKQEEVKQEEVMTTEETPNEYETLKTMWEDVITKANSIEELNIKDLLKLKKDFVSLAKAGITQTKKVEKQFNKNSSPKKKRKSTTSGFDKPIVLTSAAKTFITKSCKGEVTETLSRRDVNKYIHAYIKDNNLQNPENRREIKPDNHLKKILSELSKEKNKNGTIDAEQGYTYFNLQKYIKHIFVQQ